MSDDNLVIEMTYEEFRQREQQTTKLAEELEAMRAQVEHLQTCLDREAAKSIRYIRKRSNVKKQHESDSMGLLD